MPENEQKVFVTAEQARLLELVDNLEKDGDIKDASRVLKTAISSNNSNRKNQKVSRLPTMFPYYSPSEKG